MVNRYRQYSAKIKKKEMGESESDQFGPLKEEQIFGGELLSCFE